jgi:hypothetical protein
MDDDELQTASAGSTDDEELMRLLAESLAADMTMSPRAAEAARAAYDWVRIEAELAELAELVFDSADEPELAGVRGAAAAVRQVTYQSGELTVECEVGTEGLVGEVLPPGPARVRLRVPGAAERDLEVDERGRFAERWPPAGPFSLRVARPGRPEVATPWLLP